jgi:hypothetical protein
MCSNTFKFLLHDFAKELRQVIIKAKLKAKPGTTCQPPAEINSFSSSTEGRLLLQKYY